MKFYKLKINLLGEDKKILREILVPEDITFAYLHMNIQKAMGWKNKHLYVFIVGEALIESDDHVNPSQDSNRMPTFTKISELVDVGDTFQRNKSSGFNRRICLRTDYIKKDRQMPERG